MAFAAASFGLSPGLNRLDPMPKPAAPASSHSLMFSAEMPPTGNTCTLPGNTARQALRLCQASDISRSASAERPVESAAPRRFARTCDVTKVCSDEIYLARRTSLDFLPERGVYEDAGSITSSSVGRLGLTEDTLWLVQKK